MHAKTAGPAATNPYTVDAASIGTVWRYEVTSDRGQSTLVRTLSAVRRASNGTTYSVTDSAAGWSRTLPYFVRPDGFEIEPFAQVIVPSAGYTLRVRSGAITIPPASVLAAGTPRTSRLVLAESSSTQHLDVVLSAVTRGLGTERVTVPAGKYRAMHVRQTMTETVGSHQIRFVTDAWRAAGVGIVKTVSSTIRTTGTTSQTHQLVSVTPGSV